MSKINGKWALVSTDNLENYLKAIGVNEENRAKALPLLEQTGDNGFVEDIVVEGGGVKRTIYINGHAHVPTSPLMPFGKQVETVSLDGRPIKVTLKCEGNKFVREESGPNYTSVNTSLIQGDERILTLVTGSVTSTRKFKRIQ